MPWTSYAKTFGQIVDATRRICRDVFPDGTYGRIWTKAEVGDAVNRAVLAAVDLTGGLRASAVIPLTEDVNVYDLPSDCVRLTRVNLHGLEGYVLFPTSITEIDLIGATRAEEGDPLYFYREFLEPDQIGVLPIPYETGSTATRDTNYGLLRQIKDADGNYVTYDANVALRRITGVPFQPTGEGRVIRDVLSPYGNLCIDYIRAPQKMWFDESYPDKDIPEWFHKDIRYGAAVMLLRYRKSKIEQMRAKLFGARWRKACDKLQVRIQHQGPMGQMVTPC